MKNFNFNEDAIREAAYYIWKNAGCPANSSLQDWNAAIEQLALANKTCNNKSSCSNKNSTLKTSSLKTTSLKSASLKKSTSKTSNSKTKSAKKSK